MDLRVVSGNRLVFLSILIGFLSFSAVVVGEPDLQAGSAVNKEPSPPAPTDHERNETLPSPFDWMRWPALSGDWFGLRSKLEEKGVKTHIYLNSQYEGVVAGGLDKRFRNAGSMDAIITFDLGTMGLMEDADALLHLLTNWGGGINGRTGSAFQVNDDADGDKGLYVAQFWVRRHLFDRKLSLTLGFLDYQTILDRNAFANSEDKQFMHQILDNNPLVPLNIGLGAALTFRPYQWYTMIISIGDAQSIPYKPGFSTAFHDDNWWVAYMEHDLQVNVPSDHGALQGNYRVGLMYDPRPRPVFSWPNSKQPGPRGSDYGFYLSFDQKLYRESDKDDQGLGFWGRFVYRTPETNRNARFYSAGLSYLGFIPGRDEDVLGLGFALPRVSDDFRRKVNPNTDSETVYEMYYAIYVNPWLVITPDLQYIDNPGANGELSHTVVAGLRTRISF